jgi:hypothetical protein
MAKIRIWIGGESPDGRTFPDSTVVVEWTGQTGHPTSYALLGMAPTTSGNPVSIHTEKMLFADSLAGRADEVVFGDTGERELAVIEEVLNQYGPSGWVVPIAASGKFGSSPMAFRWVATFLMGLREVLEKDPAPTDESIWSVWDSARRS